ncbi:heavy metal-associated isoprenylated plant protein 41-like [Pistacia vera]|uniref:heavy metal-associated isoprenylated plant protein 41-like n=1 Tax=Pistacia vera TaxID=55513 RepID=UPI0012634B13|nr:heavy metal-associated isoprenylated plant protein 41-like [Pistacia vera]
MSWEDYKDGFGSYDAYDDGFGSYDAYEDGFTLAYDDDNDYEFNEFGPQDDSEYHASGSPGLVHDDFHDEFVPQYEHHASGSQDGSFTGSGLPEDDYDDGKFGSQDYSDNGCGLVYDSEDGSGSVYDSEDGSGSVYDSEDRFSLQGHCEDGFGSVYGSDDGFSSEDDSDPDWFGLVDYYDYDNDEFSLHNESFGSHEAKWIKHYCNTQDILLVGEGDFSFATCLANCFGSATNMVATSLDSSDFIVRNYGSGRENVESLRDSGCKVIHEVDAETMVDHEEIGSMSFDRIVFNFPHAGFKKSESRQSQIQRHTGLVRNFFKNAERLLSNGGEVHVVHKTNGFFKEWRIEELAAQSGLQLLEKSQFRLEDYPGYHTKYGFGGNKDFNCYPSMTYKFGRPTC